MSGGLKPSSLFLCQSFLRQFSALGWRKIRQTLRERVSGSTAGLKQVTKRTSLAGDFPYLCAITMNQY